MRQPNRRKDDVLIGRIDERLLGLDRSFLAHEVEDHARFELVFGHMKDSFDKMEKRFDKIDTKLGILWDQNNSTRGAFSASRVAMGALWAVIVLATTWFIQRMG